MSNYYSQGVCEDGAVILKNGKKMTVDEIVMELNCFRDVAKSASMAMFSGDNSEKKEVIMMITDIHDS